MQDTTTAPILPDTAELLATIQQNADALIAQAEALEGRIEAKTAGPTARRGRKPRQIENPLYKCNLLFSDDSARGTGGSYPSWLDDVLQGVARLDWYRPNERSIPLSVKRLAGVLTSTKAINTREVMRLLQIDERHSRRYVQALEIAMPFMLKAIPPATMRRLEALIAEQEEASRLEDETFAEWERLKAEGAI